MLYCSLRCVLNVVIGVVPVIHEYLIKYNTALPRKIVKAFSFFTFSTNFQLSTGIDDDCKLVEM